MTGHPDDEKLLTYCENEGSNPAVDVATHVASGCARCLSRVQAFREVLASLQSPALEKAPVAMVREALERIRKLRETEVAGGLTDVISEVADRARQTIREIQLQLVLDSRQTALLSGIRSNTTTQPRQLMYEAPQANLYLQIREGRQHRHEIMGQLASRDAPIEGQAWVDLEADGRNNRCELAETGEFRFEAIAAERVSLSIEWGNLRLTTGQLSLQEGADV